MGMGHAGAATTVVSRLPRLLRASIEVVPWSMMLGGTLAPAVPVDDATLIRSAASGDHDAFEALIAPRVRRLIALARKILRDPDTADDAAQQALVSAWRTLPRLRDPGSFDAWLTKLLINACYTEARRRRRSSVRVEELTGVPQIDDGAAARADRAALEAAFIALTPEHRAIVILRHYADLPLADVAAIVGVPPGTARSRLHYALRSLRAALEASERPVVEELQ